MIDKSMFEAASMSIQMMLKEETLSHIKHDKRDLQALGVSWVLHTLLNEQEEAKKKNSAFSI